MAIILEGSYEVVWDKNNYAIPVLQADKSKVQFLCFDERGLHRVELVEQ